MTAATLTRPTATCHPRPMQATPAIVLADGCLATLEGKVAHGLVRGSDRFSVRVVVDHTLTRCDAGLFVNGTPAGRWPTRSATPRRPRLPSSDTPRTGAA